MCDRVLYDMSALFLVKFIDRYFMPEDGVVEELMKVDEPARSSMNQRQRGGRYKQGIATACALSFLTGSPRRDFVSCATFRAA